MQSELTPEEQAAGIVPSHGISLDLPTDADNAQRPAIVSHLYAGTFTMPLDAVLSSYIDPRLLTKAR